MSTDLRWQLRVWQLRDYLSHIERAPTVSVLDAINIEVESSTLLKESPHDPEALYLHMSACIHLEQLTEAQNDLDTLQRWHPTHAWTVVANSKMLRARAKHDLPLLRVRSPPHVNTQPAHVTPSRGTYYSAVTDTNYYNRQHFNQMEYNARHNEWRRQDNQYAFNRWYNREP
ncbi:hypothetical protein K457DRAFT_143549 [Linnemannia elongata AG-77]|uniref:Uncharacterized protein n=1 Tax=Linnemannia elongata AG-77 TaxID=1314771 RepID=A0A197JCR1_9FUNG|nr:hypothetical protein K457DRAFT_143549 [Linnemannia elongata AG-77]